MPPSEARRQYLRAYQRKWLADRRSAYLADKACAKCGSTDRLEIDHTDPATKDPRLKQSAGSTLWGWSAARREVELAKCQILCFSCHLTKTIAERKVEGCARGHPYDDANTYGATGTLSAERAIEIPTGLPDR